MGNYHFTKVIFSSIGLSLLAQSGHVAIAQTENPWSSLATTSAAEVVPESSISSNTQRGAIHFQLPDNTSNPDTTVGGGSRGSIGFSLPDQSSNPNTTVGGGSRGSIGFSLPDNSSNPDTTIGGGSRDQVQFRLPGSGKNPSSTLGGGSRGGVQFSLPDDKGNPIATIGGGSRAVNFSLPSGSSSNPNTSIGAGSREGISRVSVLKPVLPPNGVGQTADTHPTIFVYLPALGSEEVFFSLQDEAGEFYFDTVLPTSPDGGVMAVKIPDTIADLEVDKYYLWYFAPIEPGGRLLPNNYAVTGWVKRVAAEEEVAMAAEDPVQQAIAYAQQGLWYDTIESLAIALASDSDNATYQTEWQDLLEQVDLEALSTEPIIGTTDSP